jgi:DNA-binding MarR family transcriptional regulator
VSHPAKSSPPGAAGQTDEAYAPGCTCFYLRSATRRITQVYDDVLKAVGLSVNQYSLLSQLSRNGGISVSAFAEVMSMDRTTLTRNLQPLEAAGWIVSGCADAAGARAAGVSARRRLLTLTDAGEAKLREAMPLWEMAQARVNEMLGADTQQTLHRTLRASIRTFKDQQPLGS